MTAGEFNELAKQGRVWAKIVANFSGKYGLVEKISGLTNQFVRFRSPRMRRNLNSRKWSLRSGNERKI